MAGRLRDPQEIPAVTANHLDLFSCSLVHTYFGVSSETTFGTQVALAFAQDERQRSSKELSKNGVPMGKDRVDSTLKSLSSKKSMWSRPFISLIMHPTGESERFGRSAQCPCTS